MGTIYMFTLIVIPTERSEWRNLFRDVSTTLDMTSVNGYPFALSAFDKVHIDQLVAITEVVP